MWNKVCLLFHISYSPSSYTTGALTVSARMFISAGITFRCVLIIIWWRSQEYLFTGTPSYSAAHKPGTEHSSAGDDWENSKFKWERGDGVTQMCCCSERAACIQGKHALPRTTTHKAIYTCIDSSATQSSWLRANPSIAGWLGSNHHSQQGQNERMADSRRRGPLSHSRLMGQISGRFMRHPISKRTYHKNLWCPNGTRKQAFQVGLCMKCVFVAWRFCCQKCVFHSEAIFAVQP